MNSLDHQFHHQQARKCVPTFGQKVVGLFFGRKPQATERREPVLTGHVTNDDLRREYEAKRAALEPRFYSKEEIQRRALKLSSTWMRDDEQRVMAVIEKAKRSMRDAA